MTAINVILSSDSAHMITDGAITDDSGSVLMIGPKVYSFPHIGAAISIRGAKGIAVMIAEGLSLSGKKYDFSSYDKLKATIRPFLSEFLSSADAGKLDGMFPAEWRELDIVVAGWSDAQKRADAFFIVTHNQHPVVPTMKVIDTGAHLIAPTHPALMADIEPRISAIIAGEACDSCLDEFAADLIERQRQLEPNVGGFAQVTTVTRSAITSRIVARFPDKIGDMRKLAA